MNGEPIISVDWLQFFVDLSYYQVPWWGGEEILQAKSRTFSEICTISLCGQVVATICRKPYSPVISPTCGTLKIENEFLYLSNSVKLISQIFSDFGIRMLSVTRVDLCGDFERIAGGQPGQLILDLINGKRIKVGHSKYYVHGEDFWKAKGIRQIGERTWVVPNSWEVVGSSSTMRVDYLRYGTNNSNVCCYMYNKSKELREVKDKPYIRNRWKDTHADVWRLEFSIKGRRMSFIEKESGVVMPDDWTIYFSPAVVTYFISLCSHYFNIRENTGQVRKDREKMVDLWGNANASVFYIADIHDMRPSNKADRQFVGKLYAEMKDAEGRGDYDYACRCRQLGQEFVVSHDLWEWSVKKGVSFGDGVKEGQSRMNLPSL